MMKKNLFIAFEGIDGSGKSTQSKLLADALAEKGYSVQHTFEPTQLAIGKMIREVLTGKRQADPRVVAAMFVADRLQHILDYDNGMLKWYKEGKTVITDRYYFSSFAYQGTEISLDWLIKANELSATIMKPDLHVFIDISPETAMERIQQNREVLEIYETLENLKKVRELYFKAFEILKAQENILIIEGNRNREIIAQEILEKTLETVSR